MKRLLFSTALILIFAARLVLAQTSVHGSEMVHDATCGVRDFEKDGFQVAKVKVDTPFSFLPWIKAKKQRISTQIAALVIGKPFTYDTAVGKALEIINNEDFLPETPDVRVRFRLEFVGVENCKGTDLDLVYNIYSTQIAPVLNSSPEERQKEKEAPDSASGLTNVDAPSSRPYHFKPIFGYDSLQRFYGGGQFQVVRVRPSKLPFQEFSLEAYGSSNTRYVAASLRNSLDSVGPFVHFEWRLDFTHYSLPTGSGEVRSTRLSGAFSGTSKPLFKGNAIFRLGGLFEGGHQQSTINKALIPSDTVADTPFGALKLYGGFQSRLRSHTISASYGLQIGASGREFRIDWIKQIGDFRHQFWHELTKNRFLDMESRLTFGSIRTRGIIPLSERFFGGNAEKAFIPGDSWEIRESPVIRAIPGAGYFLTPEGAGGKQFVSYNLTAAFDFWRKPLVPDELSGDPKFAQLLDDALESSTNPFPYLAKDTHFVSLVALLPQMQNVMTLLDTEIKRSESAHPGQFVEAFKSCNGALKMAHRRMKSALEPKNSEQYGNISALLSVDTRENRLFKVASLCLTELNNKFLMDPQISAQGVQFENQRNRMEQEFAMIDVASAEKKAREDLAFARRTLNTLIYDTSIYSFGPVFVYDVARMGGNVKGFTGTRHGPGAGFRVTLVDSASLTIGYAWNTRPGVGEGRGNVFFSIAVRDLFR